MFLLFFILFLTMSTHNFFLINVFTGQHARGNQCCALLVDDLTDGIELQRIASDFNLPATTFLKRESDDTFSVRWFAPMAEIGLCGHGTMAATFALQKLYPHVNEFTYNYPHGVLKGGVGEGFVTMSGEAILCEEVHIPEHVEKGFHGKAVAYFKSSNKDLVLFENEKDIFEMKPKWDALRSSDTFGYVITAPSSSHDFVSRVLLPHIRFLEDQATGSAHLLLIPFWSERLGKNVLNAFQASERGGELEGVFTRDSVTLKAQCLPFGEGTFIKTI